MPPWDWSVGEADGIGRIKRGYTVSVKLVLLLLILVAVLSAVAFVRMGRTGRTAHGVWTDRERPMKQWAPEREIDGSLSAPNPAERKVVDESDSERRG